MRTALWPDGAADHAGEIAAYFDGRVSMPLAVLIAIAGASDAVGFVELSIRNYAESCTTDRIAYLEGWYVDPAARGRGVGRALIEAAEEWARAQGCTEFGSDAEIENALSASAHKALGFRETAQIRCFLKSL
jgi:aminoglycoside 6'-N-acetyltransferase I